MCRKEEKPPTSGSDQKKVSDWDSSTSHKVQIQEPVLKLGNLKMVSFLNSNLVWSK